MTDWLLRHRFAVVVVVAQVVALVIMYVHGKRGEGTTFLERQAIKLAGFCQNVAQKVVGGVGSIIRDYVWLVGVKEENTRLKEENERLLGEAMEAKRLAHEVQTLREALVFRGQHRETRMWPAQVVARELSPYYKVLRLYLKHDSPESVRSGMAVLTPRGLVGRVARTVGSYVDVMLITDSRSRVAGEVQGKGILGMVVGTGRSDDYRLRFQVSVSENNIEDGAVVVTSGHDRVFPRGIEIGYVRDAASRKQIGTFMEYQLVPAVNPAMVEYVFMVEQGFDVPR